MSKPPRPISPTPESLLLQASTFTSTISSWLPPNFGISKTESQLNLEFDKILRSSGGSDDNRLGVGHASIGQQVKTGGFGRGGLGLGGLEGRLRKGQGKGKHGEEEVGVGEAMERGREGSIGEEEEEEEESRSRSIARGKRKAGHLDLLTGKKKARPPKASSDPNGSSESTPLPPTETAEPVIQTRVIEQTPQLPAPDPHSPPTKLIGSTRNASLPITPPHPASSESITFPFAGPVALDSPTAQRIILEQSPASPFDETGTDNDKARSEDGIPPLRVEEYGIPSSSLSERNGLESLKTEEAGKKSLAVESKGRMSKTQARREKRKQARSAKTAHS